MPTTGETLARPDDGPVDAMFLVVGTLHGQARTVAVGGPAEALAEIVRWCVADPDASGRWLLNPSSPEPVTLIARRKRGLIGESRRVSHLFELSPGVPQGLKLAAHCGSPVPITELEWLDLDGRRGMPCVGCLGALASRLPALDEDDNEDGEDDAPMVAPTPDQLSLRR